MEVKRGRPTRRHTPRALVTLIVTEMNPYSWDAVRVRKFRCVVCVVVGLCDEGRIEMTMASKLCEKREETALGPTRIQTPPEPRSRALGPSHT